MRTTQPNSSAAIEAAGEINSCFTFVVEHLDPELGPWSALEYRTIARECRQSQNTFILSSVPEELVRSDGLQDVLSEGGKVERRGVEVLFSEEQEGRGPDHDGGEVDEAGEKVGMRRVCLLDPKAQRELDPDDGEMFKVFLFGGILGDDPPRGHVTDRTSELRKRGYEGRRLGPQQMTTDTAVRVTRMVVQDKVPLDKIPYIDFPELKLDEHESTELPFRYVKDEGGRPVMPEGMGELIKKDADKGFDDFLR